MNQVPSEPANLRFLRHLVTVLTATMILGVTLIVVLLFIRLNRETPAQFPTLPATITLPDGVRATAVTAGAGWYAVVTDTSRLLVFDATSGAIVQEVEIRADGTGD